MKKGERVLPVFVFYIPIVDCSVISTLSYITRDRFLYSILYLFFNLLISKKNLHSYKELSLQSHGFVTTINCPTAG